MFAGIWLQDEEMQNQPMCALKIARLAEHTDFTVEYLFVCYWQCVELIYNARMDFFENLISFIVLQMAQFSTIYKRKTARYDVKLFEINKPNAIF